MLADGESLRRALGVSWPDEKLGVPSHPKDVENIADPKQVLEQTIGRLSRSTSDHYTQLGAMVSLAKLLEVPAFNGLWRQTREALTDLGFR